MHVHYYKKWEPIYDVEKEMYLVGLHHDNEGFRVLLKGSNQQTKTLKIMFDYILTYRNMDEFSYLNNAEEDDLMTSSLCNDSENYVGNGQFFIVENSAYIRWFQSASKNIHQQKKLMHYACKAPISSPTLN